ncbi:MAG: hypothetical protein JKX97_07955 [Candidatus Lindowbacteria bacterium]|nr:hypothetical protein [Candidatus Lindowbacteria bacterium]
MKINETIQHRALKKQSSCTRALVWREVRGHTYVIFFGALLAVFASWSDEIVVRTGRMLTDGSFFGEPVLTFMRAKFLLLSQPYLTWLFLLPMMCAGMLAWRQIKTERSNNVTLFLLHRPVSRARIFDIKVISGFMILLGLFIPPFVLRVLWTSLPGHHQGPFVFEMAYPGFAQILASLLFYLGMIWACSGRVREIYFGCSSLGAALIWGGIYSAVGAPVIAELIFLILVYLYYCGARRAFVECEL